MVQMRLKSSRVPSKMLCKIGDHELIYWVMYRLKQTGLNHVIICAAKDNITEEFAKKLSYLADKFGFFLFWGDEDNVAQRFLMAFSAYSESYEVPSGFQILRVCGDRPFLEKSFLDSLITNNSDVDIAYNHHYQGRLTGFGYELLGQKLSQKIFNLNGETLLNKEHVTLNIYHDTNYICKSFFPTDVPLDRLNEKHKFDLDTHEDIARVNALVDKLGIKSDTKNIYKALLGIV